VIGNLCLIADRKKLLKSVKLYGAAQPEGADLNDGVAEIMDIVADDGLSEEELEDREVTTWRL